METIFLKLVNMSITAGWLVLAVILLRLILKKAPRAILCLLWGLVGIRLILPVSLESALSLIPSTETVPENIGYAANPTITSGISAVNSIVNPLLQSSLAPDPTYIASVNPMQIVLFVAAWVWIFGMAGMLIYTLISYLRIAKKVRESAPLRDNIRVCDHIDTPFILGMFRPRIYLPSSINEADAEFVIAHEKAHLARRDHLWKPLGFLLLSVYWFNPLLWVAYVLLCRDIEVACDQKVIKSMGAEIKKPYSEALINCSVPRKMIAACPLAFGEVGVKSRIKSVLNYKKPAFWIIVAAIVTCLIVSVCFLTDPVSINVTQIKDANGNRLPFESTKSIRLTYGDYYYEVPFSEDIKKELRAIKVKTDPIGEITTEPLFEPFYKITLDDTNQLCFKADLTECWLNGHIRPYSVYRIKDPAYVKDFLKKYVPRLSVANFDDQTQISGVLDDGKRYFYATVLDVGVDRITVLAADNSFEADYNKDGNALSVYTAIMPSAIPQLKMGDIICVIYHGIMAQDDPNETVLYGHSISKSGSAVNSPLGVFYYDTIQYDIDKDGTTEVCNLGVDFRSGPFTFTLLIQTPSEIGFYNKYFNRFLSEPYTSVQFIELFGDLYVKLFPSSRENFDLYHIGIEDNHIVLTKVDYKMDIDGFCAQIEINMGECLSYWGTQGVGSLGQGIAQYDTIMYDIDDDGIQENCSLSIGPSSGVFTFTFSASDDTGTEYKNVFLSEAYTSLSFRKGAGKLYVQGGLSPYDELETGETDLFEVNVENGHVVLTEVHWKGVPDTDDNDFNYVFQTQYGESLAYWGTQGVDN